MSPDVLLECPRTSFRDVLRVNVMERVWIFPHKGRGGGYSLGQQDRGLFLLFINHLAETLEMTQLVSK